MSQLNNNTNNNDLLTPIVRPVDPNSFVENSLYNYSSPLSNKTDNNYDDYNDDNLSNRYESFQGTFSFLCFFFSNFFKFLHNFVEFVHFLSIDPYTLKSLLNTLCK